MPTYSLPECVTSPEMPDAYLAEDENAVLRRSAPAPCVDCAHYQAKHSRAVDQVLIRCGAVQDGPNAHLLSSVFPPAWSTSSGRAALSPCAA